MRFFNSDSLTLLFEFTWGTVFSGTVTYLFSRLFDRKVLVCTRNTTSVVLFNALYKDSNSCRLKRQHGLISTVFRQHSFRLVGSHVKRVFDTSSVGVFRRVKKDFFSQETLTGSSTIPRTIPIIALGLSTFKCYYSSRLPCSVRPLHDAKHCTCYLHGQNAGNLLIRGVAYVQF